MIPMTTVEDIEIIWCPEGEDPAPFMKWISDKELIGFDVETGGPDPLNCFHPEFEVRIISFAAGNTVWVLHGSHHEAIQMALALDATFVAHNATFDSLACRRAFGVAPGTVLDTFLLALLVYPPAGVDDEEELALEDRHRLKPLSVMTGSRALANADAELHRWFQTLHEKPRGGDQSDAVRAWEGLCYATCPVDDERYWIYNALDSVFCVRLLLWLMKRWEGDPAKIRNLIRVESRLGQILAGIQWRGLRVDRESLGTLFRAAVDAQQALLPKFALYGISNPASHPEVHNALMEHGVIEPVLSEAEQISTDKTDGMPRLLEPDQPDEVREIAELLLEFRGHQKLRSKVREISALVLHGDGHRVHPAVNALKAKTGRMSIQRPALQNLPKDDQRIRAAFLAEDGMLLVGADFSQVEIRVAAALSGDQNMIDTILQGKDQHNATAEFIFGPEFTQQQRGWAKNATFAVQYGGGPKRLAAMTKLSHKAAKTLIDKFFKAYPKLKKWIDKVGSETLIELHSGRRVAIDPNRTYANANYWVQGTARDIFVQALLRLQESGWAEHLWLVIHDEIILQVPAERAEEARLALEDAMRMVFLGVPITADAKILGDRWGKLPEEEEELVAA